MYLESSLIIYFSSQIWNGFSPISVIPSLEWKAQTHFQGKQSGCVIYAIVYIWFLSAQAWSPPRQKPMSGSCCFPSGGAEAATRTSPHSPLLCIAHPRQILGNCRLEMSGNVHCVLLRAGLLIILALKMDSAKQSQRELVVYVLFIALKTGISLL